MKLLRSFRLALFALLLLSIVAFGAVGASISFLLLTGALAALAWYVTEGPRGLALPKTAANLFIVVASLGMVFDVTSDPADAIGALGRFSVWLMLIKLYERRTHRDHAQLLWLSLVVMAAGMLKSRELLFGIALLAYCALGMYALLLYQLHAAYERATEERRESAPREARLIPPLRPVLGRAVGAQFSAVVAGVGALALLASIAVFLGFPRGIGLGVVRQLMQTPPMSQSGFVNEVNLFSGVGQRISESMAPVLQVRVLDPRGEPIDTGDLLYLRGAALDSYDPESRTWTAHRTPASFIVQGESGPEQFTSLINPASDDDDAASKSDTAQTLEVTPLLPLDATIFSLRIPTALSTEFAERFAFDRTDQTITLPEARWLHGYRVRVEPSPSARTMRGLSGDRPPAVASARPYDNERVRREAVRLLGRAGLSETPPPQFPARGDYNRRAARVFADHLQQNLDYTLDLSGVAIDDDPIEEFLLEFKRGHCEFFASAMTAMCQTLGIEARLVTGFLGADHLGEGEYIIREANAHAWAEVRTGRFTWTAFDPSPPSSIPQYHLPSDTLADHVRNIYEMLEVGWMRNIVDFDRGSQRRVGETFQFESIAWLDDAVGEVSRWLEQFIRRFGIAGTLQIAAIVAALFVAGLIVARLIARVRRIRRSLHLEHVHGKEYRRLLRQLGFYLDMLDVLRRAGFRKPVWQPPLAFSELISRTHPQAGEYARILTNAFYEARYGWRPLTGARAEAVKTALHRLAESLSVRF